MIDSIIYPSINAACTSVVSKVDVGPDALRRWVVRARIEIGYKDGPTTVEAEALNALQPKPGLKEANEVPKAGSVLHRE